MSSFIRDQLDLVSGDTTVLYKGDKAIVQCPFHKDGQEVHPSLMVNLDNPKYKEGFYYCLSCGTKGDWNTLAAALGLEEIIEGYNPLLSNSFSIKPIIMNPPSLKKKSSLDYSWNSKNDWRSISGELLKSLDARSGFNSTTNDKQLVLPVKIVTEIVGDINCSIIKRSKGQLSNYIYSPGAWVRKALFPFDHTLMMMKEIRKNTGRNPPVYIVEGPRDALNLIQLGLPALAILGCYNWSKASIPLLSIINPSKYIILMDGDDAGAKASEIIYHDLIKVFQQDLIKVLKLPKEKDPADLTKEVAKWLEKTFEGPLIK